MLKAPRPLINILPYCLLKLAQWCPACPEQGVDVRRKVTRDWLSCELKSLCFSAKDTVPGKSLDAHGLPDRITLTANVLSVVKTL